MDQIDNVTDDLWTLADRIARNREIAGLHYPSDTAAGKAIATATLPQVHASVPLFLANTPSAGNLAVPACGQRARNRNGNRGQDHERREVRRDWSKTGPGPGILLDLEKRFTGFPVPTGPFDPSTASPQLLRTYRLPPRPDANRQPLIRETWDKGFGRPLNLQAFTGPAGPGRRYPVPPVS